MVGLNKQAGHAAFGPREIRVNVKTVEDMESFDNPPPYVPAELPVNVQLVKMDELRTLFEIPPPSCSVELFKNRQLVTTGDEFS